MRIWPSLPILALTALAACSSAPSKFFVLTPEPAAARPNPPGRTTIALGAVELPGAIDRPQMARRSGPNQLTYSEDERWAGALDDMVRRVLAADLGDKLPAGAMLIAAQSGVPAAMTIAIEISRFDADRDGQVTLAARWETLDRVGAPLGPPREATVVVPGAADAAAVAATMSRALADLSTRIATGLGPLPLAPAS